ncbi:hypothetical protein CDV55_103909 [Aspergillus turcosus]|nr:hypothetical protein CDV55_103909 [Aspergillus turcosus]
MINQSPLPTRKRKASHDNLTPVRVAGSYQRTKTANACLVCRARKTKCDSQWPVCGFCKSTGGECTYSQPNASRFDQASQTILHQLDRLENLLNKQSNQLEKLTNDGFVRHHGPPPPHTSLGSPIPGDVVSPSLLSSCPSKQSQDYGQFQFALDSDIPSPGYPFDQYAARIQGSLDTPPSSEILSRTTSEMGIEAMLRWPVFERRLDELGIPSNKSLIELLGQASSNMATLEIGSRGSRLDTEVAMSLNAEVVRQLVENFLVNNNLKNPVIDPTCLRNDAQEFLESPLQWDGKSCLVVSILREHGYQLISVLRDEYAFRSAELYFHASQRRIGALYCENSLLAAQCAFLTGVYLMYTMRIMAAWKAFVQAGTQCLGYFASRGLIDTRSDSNIRNRDKAVAEHSNPEASSDPRALEDSLYWSCLKSEVELRLELGLPGSGVNSAQYPHIFPSVPNLEDPEAIHLAGTLPGSTPSFETDKAHLVTGWFFYLGEIALKRLTYRILLYRYGNQDGSKRNKTAQQSDSDHDLRRSVMEFDLQLDQWMQSLPPPMRFSPTSTEPLHDILPWVLRGHRIDVIELLRFPAILSILNHKPCHSTDGSSFDYTRPTFSATTLQLAKEYLENAIYRIETNAEGFLHRHQGSWLTIRSCTRSALALLGTKLYCQEDDEGALQARLTATFQTNNINTSRDVRLADRILPARWRYAVLLVLDMLKAWEPESQDIGWLREVVEGLLGLCYD